MRKLRVDSQSAAGKVVVTVRGELDLDSSPDLLEEIRRRMAAAPRMELHLAGVEYVDSSGIAVLVQGYKLARRGSVEYVLVDPSSPVMRVITLSQLQDFFAIETAPPAGGAE
jgi:anti-sigma B factor antagonist